MALTTEDLAAISQLLDSRLQPIKDDLESVKGDLNSVKGDLNSVKGDLNSVKGDLNSVKGDLNSVKSDLNSVKSNMEAMNKRLTALEMVFENQISKNIMRVAEGHLDLNRKLDNALRADAEREMIAIKVNIHDDEIKKIKEYLALA